MAEDQNNSQHMERQHRALAEPDQHRLARSDSRLCPQIDQEVDKHRRRHGQPDLPGKVAPVPIDREPLETRPTGAAR